MIGAAAYLVLAAMFCWLLGGMILRAAGASTVIAGLAVIAITGSLSGGPIVLLGLLAWLARHWLFAVRHRYFRSVLARRILRRMLPPRLTRPVESPRSRGV